MNEILERKAERSEDIRQVMAIINKYDGIAHALKRAEQYIEEGKGYLEKFPDAPAKEALIAIADYVVKRRL